MARSRWLHLVMVTVMWSGVYIVTKGDSCSQATPPTTVATPSPGTPLDQLAGVVVVVTIVSEAGEPVPGANTSLSWSPDNDRIAGTTSSGTTDANGQITFSDFPDADFGTWNLTVEGNYTQTISRARKATNPNQVRQVIKVLPSPSPSPSESPSPSPSPSESPEPSPSPSAAPTPTPTATAISFSGSSGGSATTTVTGSSSVNTQVVITAGSPQAAYPHATLP